MSLIYDIKEGRVMCGAEKRPGLWLRCNWQPTFKRNH